MATMGATLGGSALYSIPKQASGLKDMGLSVTDALGMTGADEEDARNFVAEVEKETGGDPYYMARSLQAALERLGPRANEDWAAPIREAARVFGVQK